MVHAQRLGALPVRVGRSLGLGGLLLGLTASTGAALALRPDSLLPALAGALFLAGFLANPVVPVGLVVLLSGFSLSFLADRSVAFYGSDVNDWIVLLLVLGALGRCLVSGLVPVRARVTLSLVAGALVILPPFGTPVDLSAGLKLIVQATVPFVVFLVVRYGAFGLDNGALARAGARLLAAAIALSGAFTLVALLTHGSLFSAAEGGAQRFTGSLGSGSYAFFLLAPIAIAVVALAERPTLCRAAVLTALGTSLLVTLTRGAFIATAVAIAWVALAYRRVKGVLVVCLVLAGVVFALFQAFPAAADRFEATSAVPKETVRGTWLGREVLWDFAWRHFVEPSPFLGSGLGATAAIFRENTDFRTGAGAMHNDYLWILAETGALGLGLYLAALAAVFRAAIRGWRRRLASSGALGVARRAAPPALLAFLVVSFADNAIDNFAHFGVLVLGLAGLAARAADHRNAVV